MMDNSSYLYPKRRCKYQTPNDEDPESDNPASSHSSSGSPAVLMLMTGAMSSYLRAGGHHGSRQLINTCVLDAILAAIHICYIKWPNVKSLLESNCKFHLIMCYLNCENYNDAKLLWLRTLNRLPNCNPIDIAGTVKDHLPMFAQLVCAQVDYRQETPKHHPIYETTLSKFRAFGNVMALGHESNPALILVDCDVGDDRNLVNPLVLCVKDDLNRTFELDFALLGRGRHMVMCFSMCAKWILYDDDPVSPAFQTFNFEDLDDYTIYLTGYVNKAEAKEYYPSAPETGVGTMPFHSGSKQQEESCSSETVEDLLLNFNNLQCAGSPSQSGSPTDEVQMSND